jgi:hypothetical protein
VCSGGAGCTHPTCGVPTCGQTLQVAASDPQALAALKAQLQQALAEVDKQGKAAEEALRPQTVAEVDALQKKLQDAMDELKTRRAELEKQEKAKK